MKGKWKYVEEEKEYKVIIEEIKEKNRGFNNENFTKIKTTEQKGNVRTKV